MKTIAVICARMGSTRLPGKVVMPINGVPILHRIIQRVRAANSINGLVVASPEEPHTFEIEDVSHRTRAEFYKHRGDPENTLERIVSAVDSFYDGEDCVVVRVCGDTPFIDPMMIDLAVYEVKSGRCDIAMAKNKDRKFPQGTTAHVCKLSSLKEILEKSNDPAHLEHATLALYEEGSPFKGRVHEMEGMKEWELPPTRLQVDYPEDLQVAREIQSRLRRYKDKLFGITEIVDLLKREPWIREINAHCEEKPVR